MPKSLYQSMTRGHMMSLFYLHVCYLVLFPVKALHLVLFQFLSGLHILVIVTLIMKIDLHCHPTGWHTYIFSNSLPLVSLFSIM